VTDGAPLAVEIAQGGIDVLGRGVDTAGSQEADQVIRSGALSVDLLVLAFPGAEQLAVEDGLELGADAAGIQAEVIDLRTVDAGWDAPVVIQSADKTGSLLVAEEDRLTGGFGATIAARVAEELPGVLIKRLSAKDGRVAYGPEGERAVLPQVDDIIAQARRLVEE